MYVSDVSLSTFITRRSARQRVPTSSSIKPVTMLRIAPYPGSVSQTCMMILRLLALPPCEVRAVASEASAAAEGIDGAAAAGVESP